MTAPVALLRFMPDGELQISIFGWGGLRFLVVDERCPADGMHEVTARQPIEELAQLVKQAEPIGSAGDERHLALTARWAARPGTSIWGVSGEPRFAWGLVD